MPLSLLIKVQLNSAMRKKGEYLEFFVKDTGIGIPQKQQQ